MGGGTEQSGSPATEEKYHSASDNRVRSLLCADTPILYHQYQLSDNDKGEPLRHVPSFRKNNRADCLKEV